MAHACVDTLPTELMLIIFDLVYDNGNQRKNSHEFPYTLAVVCRRWLELLLSRPRYWKCILIFLSGEFRTPLPVIHACTQVFDNSDVYVSVRENYRDEDAHASESDLSITAVMQAILPHIHRVKSLYLDLDFSSSLPRIGRDLHGHAGNLQALRLSCIADDGSQDKSSEDENTLLPNKFIALNLRDLHIDGRNFVSACTMPDNTSWTRAIRFIDIIHLRPSASEEKFRVISAIEALSLFPCLEEISFKNVDMSYDSQRDVHYGPYRFSRLTELFLENLSAETLAGFRAIDARLMQLKISCCEMNDPVLPYSQYLELNGINGTQNVAGTLLHWQGNELSVLGCSVFSDKILQAMSGQSDSEDSEAVTKKMLCPGLIWLSICDCLNFKASELVDMLKFRQQWHEGRFKIEQVDVNGLGPVLSQEEGTWLIQNIDDIEWDTEHPADGPYCLLEDDGNVALSWD